MALPIIVEAPSVGAPALDWARENVPLVDEILDGPGAVLLRGFSVGGQDGFRTVAAALSREGPLDYVFQSTPRTALGDRVYTATEYPATQTIPLHNENAYQRDWPMRLFFLCVTPARVGGETPIADTRRVTERIDPAVRARFVDRGVRYVRNYRAGVDVPWQKVFQANDRAQVGAFCRSHEVEHEWLADGTLRTSQRCQAVARHPRTGAEVWMNQAHLFHASSIDVSTREALVELFGVEGLPRNSFYGNGEPIEESALDHVRAAFEAEAIVFPWRAEDVLVVDNMLVSHGRRPFQGDRRVLVAMSDAFSSAGHDAPPPQESGGS